MTDDEYTEDHDWVWAPPSTEDHDWVWAPPSLDTAQEALKRMYFEAWKDAEQQAEDWKHRAVEAEAKLNRLRRALDDEYDRWVDC